MSSVQGRLPPKIMINNGDFTVCSLSNQEKRGSPRMFEGPDQNGFCSVYSVHVRPAPSAFILYFGESLNFCTSQKTIQSLYLLYAFISCYLSILWLLLKGVLIISISLIRN